MKNAHVFQNHIRRNSALLSWRCWARMKECDPAATRSSNPQPSSSLEIRFTNRVLEISISKQYSQQSWGQVSASCLKSRFLILEPLETLTCQSHLKGTLHCHPCISTSTSNRGRDRTLRRLNPYHLPKMMNHTSQWGRPKACLNVSKPWPIFFGLRSFH